ncbi:MAG: signal recognition particle protein [Spirochaetota bacterium]|jgi:signal recognition particle subunit SRP54|nr:signal recognition particle protein [Spirochaetota bacterium]
MLEQLTARLGSILGGFGNKRLSSENIREGMREVRLALLEADVALTVVDDFVAAVSEKAQGETVLRAVSPTQQFIKIVYDQLVAMMGGAGAQFSLRKGRCSLLLCGLQGSGKTTTAAKIALLNKKNSRFLLVSADTYRPAAMEQLRILAEQTGIGFFDQAMKLKNPVDIVKKAKTFADQNGYNGFIVDTAGRLELDEAMMKEIAQISKIVKFDETFFVADATAGQSIVNTVSAFHKELNLSGLVLTKFDSDARGGAALSAKAVTGCPIVYIGTGEKPEDIEIFYPDRIASRILGKGDVLTLIEKAQEVIDQEEAERLEEKFLNNEFTLDDFLDQIRKLRKMGPISKIAGMLPGVTPDHQKDINDKDIIRVEAIISSMTRFERSNINVLGPSRRRRIAKGSGVSVADVNRMLNRYQDMRKMMKKMSKNPAIFDRFNASGLPPV